MRRALPGALTVVVAVACARPLAPPGGERDTAPPRLLSTTPEPLAIVAPADVPVVFRFDETLSERNFSETLVSVSPQDSAVRVERSGTEVRVRMDGGWRGNRVYRVVLLPGPRDRFGNARTESVELVFSTGAPVGNTALAGMVLDRITGAPARQGVVDAVQRGAGARYTAIADSTGFYSLRYLPIGEYDVTSYDDQNRNRRRDPLEPLDSGYNAQFQSATDTVTLIFNVLAPDSTGPQVTEASAIDSLHVSVELDDAIDPQQAIPGIGALVHALPDSSAYARAVRIVPATQFAAEQRAAADTAAADTAATATMEPVLLPVRELVVRLDRALSPGTWAITLGGVVNLHGLAGGGTVRFEVRPPPPPDTTGVRPDTLLLRTPRWTHERPQT
ncbi:MAG TPA: Ig-like domain-containing protein [Longimicrobiales bacterium]